MGTILQTILSSGGAGQCVTVLLDASMKGAVILVLAALLMLAMRRSCAAARHLVWFLALMSLALLPALSVALPAWHLPFLPELTSGQPPGEDLEPQARETAMAYGADLKLPADRGVAGSALLPAALSEAAPSTGAAPASAGGRALADIDVAGGSVAPGPVWPAVIVGIHAVGAAVVLGVILASVLATRRIVKRARPVTGDSLWGKALAELWNAGAHRQRVTLVDSPSAAVPFVWGFVRPFLVVPCASAEWPTDRIRAVLLHELGHVARRDCLTQMLALFVGALHWFNPLVWVAVRRMRRERERACDDRVLNAGLTPSRYARHLFHIAELFGTHRYAAIAAVAMAQKSGLEGRVRAVLDKTRSRRTLTRFGIVVALAVCGAILVMLAALEPTQEGLHADEPLPAQLPKLRTESEYILLASALSAVDQNHVHVILRRKNIPFKAVGNSIRVARADHPRAIAELALQPGGLAFSQVNLLGTEEPERGFYPQTGEQRRERRERDLELKLGMALGCFQDVASAVVFLDIPDETLLLPTENYGAASVVVTTNGDIRLNIGTQTRIKQLVAGVSRKLRPQDVVITRAEKAAPDTAGPKGGAGRGPADGTPAPIVYSDRVAWGKVVDELQLGLSLDFHKDIYYPDDHILCTVQLRNVGTKPVTVRVILLRSGGQPMMTAVGLNGEAAPLRSFVLLSPCMLAKRGAIGVEPFSLAPSQSAIVGIAVMVCNPSQPHGPGHKSPTGAPSLRTRACKVRADSVAVNVGGRSLLLATGEIELKVAEQKSYAIEDSGGSEARETLPALQEAPPPGYALRFDGADDYVEIPFDPALRMRDQFTIEMWVKADGGGVVLARPVLDRVGGGYRLHFRCSKGRSTCAVWLEAGRPRYNSAYVESETRGPDQWVHVAAVWKNSRATVFVDGVPLHGDMGEYDTGRSSVSGELPLQIGGVVYTGEEGSGFFKGIIDEVRIWSVARTGEAIRRDMTRKLKGSEPGLVGYWPFDEGSGKIAHDLSPYSLHGALLSAPHSKAAGPNWVASGLEVEPVPH